LMLLCVHTSGDGGTEEFVPLLEFLVVEQVQSR
jgi:hypothetical protein